MQQYRLHDDPYQSMPVDGELPTLKLYWKNIAAANPEAELPKLSLLLLDIKPHAADPERTVMTMVKMFNSKVPDR